VLKFERQVLKRRVKRDFIDLGNPATAPLGNGNGGGLARNAAQAHLQLQQSQQRQMLRPAARPGQLLRPPNQAPANQQHYQQHYADTRRLGQPQTRPIGQHQQQKQQQASFFEQLDMTPSGPVPFFMHANYSGGPSSSVGGGGPANSINNKHRPPPPPIQMSVAGSELHHQRNNQTFHQHHHQQQQHQPNETAGARPAPFNDPSWPLMWYLVSVSGSA
jgi:hypothetical protein